MQRFAYSQHHATTKAAVAQEQSTTSYKAPGAHGASPSGASEAVPASLKTAGYEYWGLDNAHPVPMTANENGTTKRGACLNKLVKVTSTGAIFEQDWTGELSDLGTEQVEAEPTGVFVISAFGNALAKPQ